MNYFEFYAGDYLRDTGALTLAEHGAFLLLMAAYYATEKPLPSDNPTLFRLVRAMSEEEQKAALKVAEMYFPISDEDGLRHNVRADQEIPKARARIEAARENGKRGGRPTKPKSNPVGFDPVTQQEPSGVPSTKAPHAPHAINTSLASATRGTRLPEDWKPSEEQIAWARSERRDVNPITEADRFRDYWIAQPGQKGVKTNWNATWRNWVRNVKSINGSGNHPTPHRKERPYL